MSLFLVTNEPRFESKKYSQYVCHYHRPLNSQFLFVLLFHLRGVTSSRLNAENSMARSELKTGTPVATCQAPGIAGSLLRLVGTVSVHCEWVR